MLGLPLFKLFLKNLIFFRFFLRGYLRPWVGESHLTHHPPGPETEAGWVYLQSSRPPPQVIFPEGASTDCAYIVATGTLQIWRRTPWSRPGPRQHPMERSGPMDRGSGSGQLGSPLILPAPPRHIFGGEGEVESAAPAEGRSTPPLGSVRVGVEGKRGCRPQVLGYWDHFFGLGGGLGYPPTPLSKHPLCARTEGTVTCQAP